MDEHHRITALLEANNKLLTENNELLQKAERRGRWQLVGKLVWFAILLGVPIWLYFQYLEPTLESIKNISSESFSIPTELQGPLEKFFNSQQE
jgi:hypothetical protein